MFNKLLENVFILSVLLSYQLMVDTIPLEAVDTRIVGGKIVNVQNYPYQVSLQFFGSHFCGGTLILTDTVLTAAHCCESSFSAWPISYFNVIVGSNLTNGVGETIQNIQLCSIKSHELYSAETFENDICIVKLCSNVTLSENVQPIRISENGSYSIGSIATVSGWGYENENGSLATSLRAANVGIMPQDDCVNVYEVIKINMLCVGYKEGGIDACQGDSGGPLVQNHQLIGIVSFGSGCARKYYPGVYTNVAHYLDWVINNTDYRTDARDIENSSIINNDESIIYNVLMEENVGSNSTDFDNTTNYSEIEVATSSNKFSYAQKAGDTILMCIIFTLTVVLKFHENLPTYSY